MEVIKAIILGLIQGLTEFLPVSSSGHIELGKVILNYNPSESLLFTVVLHCATVLSTIVVFRNDILEIIKGLFSFKWNEETQFAAKILLSMIPVGIVGVLFESQVEAFFNENILLVGLMLWFTGCLLYLTGYVEQKQTAKLAAQSTASKRDGKIRFSDALIIGFMQAVAVLPGISRSGSTIATGLLLGVDRERIARFSFLMVLPPILGATLLKLKDFMEAPQATIDIIPLTAGFIAAFISGLVACLWMIDLVKRGKLIYFAFYCFIVGAIAILYSILT